MIANNSHVVKLVRELAVLKNFPGWSPEAMAKIADTLARICSNLGEAEAVVDALTNGSYAEWPGIAGLHDAHRAVVAPIEEFHTPEWKTTGPAPKIQCPLCSDTGAVEAKVGWLPCRCASGSLEHAKNLNETIKQTRELKERAKAAGSHRLRSTPKAIESMLESL